MITIHLSVDGKTLTQLLLQEEDDCRAKQKKQREAEERAILMRKIAYDLIVHGETRESEQAEEEDA